MSKPTQKSMPDKKTTVFESMPDKKTTVFESMPEQKWHCTKCENTDLSHSFCEDCEYEYHTIEGKIVDSCHCKRYAQSWPTCDDCEDRKDLEHRNCDECDGAYHVDIILERYEENFIIGSCKCRKYREQFQCSVCIDHEHLEHENCAKCSGVFHVNRLARDGEQDIVGKCYCGLHNEATPVESYGDDHDNNDDLSDYEIEEPVSACYCERACVCRSYNTYQVTSTTGTYMRRRAI